MKLDAHLYLDELVLAPAEEWVPPSQGWVLLYLREGQAYWMGESAAMDFVTHALLVLPPCARGLVRASQMGMVTIAFFRFSPDLLPGILSLSERQLLESLAVKPKGFPKVIPPEASAARHMQSLLNGDVPSSGLVGRVHLIEVVAQALDWDSTEQARELDTLVHCHNRIRALVNRFTEEELCEMTPVQLAEKCGCSLQHFSRLFQSFYGVSIRSRQADLRMRRARQLLAETETPIQDVARAAGCRHISYFNTLFKKAFGITPTQYRKTCRGNGAPVSNAV